MSQASLRVLLLAGAIVLLAIVLFGYPMLLDIPLLDPDEGLHATIAQEMVERGDYVTPRMHGRAFLDKPILFFWAQALSLRALGMNEDAVRLPGVLFALLGSVTTGLLAGRLFGRTTGILAGWFHATLVLPTALAQAAVHDVALVPWTNLGMLMFWEAAHAKSRRGIAIFYLVAGFWLGLAFLTKGLVGIALVGLAFGTYLIVERRLRLPAIIGGLASLLVAFLMAAPWYALMEQRNPGYLHYYFIERHLLGYVTETQRHGLEPWWYYFPILLGGGLPWILYLPASLRQWWYERGQQSPDATASRRGEASRFVWIWLASSVLFLTVANSKMVTYLLPVFPAVAILAADVWVRLWREKAAPYVRGLMAWVVWEMSLFGPLVLPIAMRVTSRRYHLEFHWSLWCVAWLLSAGFLLPLWFWRREQTRVTVASFTLAVSAIFVFIMSAIVPRIAPVISARNLAQYLNQAPTLPSEVLIVEERIGSLIFYLDSKKRAVLKPGQIHFANYKALRTLWQQPPDALVVVPEKRVPRVSEELVIKDVPFERIGKYRVYFAGELSRTRLVKRSNPNRMNESEAARTKSRRTRSVKRVTTRALRARRRR